MNLDEINFKDISLILEPKSVAIIGASRKEGSVGYSILNNLLGKFKGKVFPINPNADSILGSKAYPTINSVEDPIDLAVIAIKAELVPEIINQCGQKGVKAAVIISAGFKETGEKGYILEEEVVEIAKKYKISIVGPNCLGIINTSPQVYLNAAFTKEMPPSGNIAFVSQSGALCTGVLDYIKTQHIGLSKVVSLGNKADVNENDILYYLWKDPLTKVILLYLEDLTDGKKFLEISKKIIADEKNRKPILALKSGRTPEGAKAVSSHTGSLAGKDEIYNALFEQAGILRVNTVKDLFDYAIAFADQPLPNGNKTVIITNAGGPGIMATDACVSYGLNLAQISSETRAKLKEYLPPHASLNNPIDLIGDAQHDRYEIALDIVLKDKNVDSVIVLLTSQSMTDVDKIAETIVQFDKISDKPIITSFLGGPDVAKGKEILITNGIPCYTFPEEAVAALSAMNSYLKFINKPKEETKIFEVDRDYTAKILTTSKINKYGFINEEVALKILEAYKIPTLSWGIAKTPEEAVEIANKIGYPVVLKIVSPDVVHKTDVGGVKLNIKNDEETKISFELIIESVKKHIPDAKIEGILVEKMANKGREVILGSKRDKKIGPVLMFGLGGIYVELLKDVNFRVAPVSKFEAIEMIKGIKTYKLLEGTRGEQPYDIEAIAECIQKLSQLVVEQDKIKELDINPLIVYEKGKGCVVADIRIAIIN